MNLFKTKKNFLFILILFPIIFIIYNATGPGFEPSFSYNGFGIDSAGVLYIGKNHAIEKHYQGKVIGTISSYTSRGYVFTILPDDTILLSTADYVYILDLSGNTLEKTSDPETKVFNKIQKNKNRFTASDGTQYVMKSTLGRMAICSETDQEIIYQDSLQEYILKIVYVAVIICFAFFIVFAVIKSRKK